MLVSKIPFLFRHPRPGDIVVFRLPDYGTLIKKIYHVESDTGAIEVRGYDYHQHRQPGFRAYP